MGMTIDTVDKWLKIQRQNLVDSSELAKDKKIESLDTAMSYLEDYQQLMRKYQKIVDIVSLNDEEFKQCGLNELKEILEVIADGNDD
jgi:hypothetical protein